MINSMMSAITDILDRAKNCGVVDCDEITSVWIHWPGQSRMLRCNHHATQACTIATAMGFELTVTHDPDYTKMIEELRATIEDPVAARFRAIELD